MIFIFFLFWASSSEDALFHCSSAVFLFPGESKICPGVFIADGTHDLTECFHVSGIHAFLHPLSDHSAEDPTKILMPWIAQEAPAVGEHPHEARNTRHSHAEYSPRFPHSGNKPRPCLWRRCHSRPD